MLFVFCKLLLLLMLEPLGALSTSPRLASRQINGCGPSPVDCGNGWCCWGGNTCQAAPEDSFVCIDTIFPKSDGSPNTFAAFNPKSWDALLSSIAQPLTFTYAGSTQILTISTASITAVANSSSGSSSSGRSIITTGPATPRTSTIIPTTTSSSLGGSSVNLVKGWWLGTVLSIGWIL
ncbi:hypothetical protein VTL71DRAFT_10132 [Oculimacula yallundae]|uniref:Uncharacterized protein n=1 Tax=Oculimacula yallundae TaxID=86028 RepID=A0ABR4BPS8_9HELO